MSTTNVGEHGDCALIHAAKAGRRVAQPIAPVAAGSPRRGLEDDSATELIGNLDVPQEVLTESGIAGGVVEQHEWSKLGKLPPAVEDQIRLDPRIGQEDGVADLGKPGSMQRILNPAPPRPGPDP